MRGGFDTLRLTGEALYGERWQRPLSRDLGVSDRMVRYWSAGDHPKPSDLNTKLAALLRAREGQLQQVIGLIKQLENEES
ncbi:hypothetical protein GCM10007925_13440 [Sphingomonas astaxanthinifaciens DSM 22298]|uniref:Transcriptional regulator n=1 Tax=Sphingomonas astaxanthinifaciens DSM 22298 TaxID=1123267 RepID=A0ABQ5Z6I9_9SPHN|nr:hypothetical protein GCM10007925_13440 [Sphingomonas astaxanthinifaciens DSM 22298]